VTIFSKGKFKKGRESSSVENTPVKKEMRDSSDDQFQSAEVV
jgi:hypothetical protein